MEPAATPSQTVGPFFAIGLCGSPRNELVSRAAPDAVRIRGRVLDGAGAGVPDSLVEICGPRSGWGRCGAGVDGAFEFITVKPEALDGQAPHLLVMVFARGLLRQVLTRLYFPDEEEANACDAVLSALDERDRATLLAVPAEDSLRFDIRLQGDGQTVFFAL